MKSQGINRREFIVCAGVSAGAAMVPPRISSREQPHFRVTGLRADGVERPLGLENESPSLSWCLESDQRNLRQVAYRVRVASTTELLRQGLGDLWDSGRVTSNRSVGVRFQGRRPSSRGRYWWSVEIWDGEFGTSAISELSWWEMGLLQPQDWTAKWLAIESVLGQGDREAGLRWIWGRDYAVEGKRRFRFNFSLPEAADAGELFAVVNDWQWSSQVSGIWIDGVWLAADPDRQATHSLPLLGLPNLSAQPCILGPMPVGVHCIAVEINVSQLYPERPHPASDYAPGFAFLGRFALASGRVFRLGSDVRWKTTLKHDSDWSACGYDDSAWEYATPAPIDGFQPLPPQSAMYLRHEFKIEQSVERARLYASALGAYEARLNGSRIGDALLTPEISQYDKRVLYRVYDVTDLLRAGGNVLGLTVGDGWYASFEGRFAWGLPPRRAIAQLELSLADGSRQIVTTAPDWKIAESPIRESQIRVGEIYDARLQQPGWDDIGFDDSHWTAAKIAGAPSCRLTSQTSPPIRITQILRPQEITQTIPGVYVFDFRQNFAGWCRLHVRGRAGTRVELKFAEVLTRSGELDCSFTDIGEPKRDVYILRGDPTGETFEPHFAYRGFRYVQVSGLLTEPTLDSLEGLVVHSDLQFTGRIETDNALINQIWRNTVWTQRSNLVSIPTDCPSREQRGWPDAGLFWDAAAFNMDVWAFTTRHLDNIVDNQSKEGAFAVVAPESRFNSSEQLSGDRPVAWSSLFLWLPWIVWRRYGDTVLIGRHWEALNRCVNLILKHNPDGLAKNCDWLEGDPVALDGRTSPILVWTAYWAQMTSMLAEMGRAIGRSKEVKQLRAIHDRIRTSFNREFVRVDGTVGSGTQSEYALALKFELLPQSLRREAVERLAADVRHRGPALTTGFLGTQFILDVLADSGFGGLAYDLLLRTEYPSWGYMVENGATTIWETWSGEGDSSSKIGKVSQNHYALASVGGFLFRRMAGIDAQTAGFEVITLRPLPDPRIKQCAAEYDSVRGRIVSEWSRQPNGDLKYSIKIPGNCIGRIYFPAQRHKRIEEGHAEVSGRRDLRVLARSDDEIVIQTGSGFYQFVVTA